MRITRLVCVLLAAITLGGCVQSVQPFLKESQYTYDGTLVGKWADEDGETFVVTGDQANNLLNVAATEKDGKTGNYVVHLGKVQGRFLLDIAPADLPLDHASDTYKAYFLPTHSFLLLDKSATGIQLTSIDYEWLGKYLTDHPDAIAHVRPDKDRIVLTATTDQLQDFVLKFIDTDGAYGKPINFKRSESLPATKP